MQRCITLAVALTPTVTETMHATAEVRGTKAMPRAKGCADDESSTFTPTVTETMHTTGEVRGTQAMQRAKASQTTSQALSSRR